MGRRKSYFLQSIPFRTLFKKQYTREIELVISPQTVKKRTGNIYGKLGVSNCTGAVARAREVGLLE